jgi:beta-galactosidase
VYIIILNVGILLNGKGLEEYCQDGFSIGVNYSDKDFELNLPSEARIMMGSKILKPAEVEVEK